MSTTSMTVIVEPNGDLVFNGRVSHDDAQRTNFGIFDRAVLEQADQPDASPHDWLLALTIIFKRIAKSRR